MSYADHRRTPRERLAAFGLVGLVQGAVAVALITGLAATVTTRTDDPPIRIDLVPVDPPPPPPPVEIAPEKPLATMPVPVHAPPRTVETPIAEQAMTTTVDVTPIPVLPPVAESIIERVVAPPPPAAVDRTRGASTRGSVGDWFPRDAYPAAALRAGSEGRVTVALQISTSGRATSCDVVSGSGDATLDAATCRLAMRNGRFEAARDAGGQAVASRITLPPVTWRIEG